MDLFLRILAAIVLLICLLIAGIWYPCSPRSQQTLERNFFAHREEIETLARMSDADARMSRIADDFTWAGDSVAWPRPESQWGITQARWDEYRRLFRRARLNMGLSRYGSGDIYFLADTTGLVTGGVSYGYLRCSKTVSEKSALPCRERKAEGQMRVGQDGLRYKKLDSDWYYLEEYS